ncbi:MAG: hypothetical protein ABR540_19945 [Acidimicrobiales bacterium]
MSPRIGWSAVLAGAAIAVAVAVLTILVVEVVDAIVGIDGGSNWVFAFYAVVLAGVVVGARRAAQRRADAPIVHGVVTALTAYAVVAVAASAVRLAADKTPDPVPLAFNALMAASAGILGGLLAGPPRPSGDGAPEPRGE